eukprot:6463828-Amphidinium_carterae.1
MDDLCAGSTSTCCPGWLSHEYLLGLIVQGGMQESSRAETDWRSDGQPKGGCVAALCFSVALRHM